MGPWLASSPRMASLTASASVTSNGAEITRTPGAAAINSSTARATVAASLPLTITEAPAAATPLARVRPIPRVEPVISTRRSDRSKGESGIRGLLVVGGTGDGLGGTALPGNGRIPQLTEPLDADPAVLPGPHRHGRARGSGQDDVTRP